MTRERKLETLRKVAYDNEAYYFKVTRATHSGVLKLMSVTEITDFHLDSYVMEFYDRKKETRVAYEWMGTDTLGLLKETLQSTDTLYDN